MHIHIHIDMHIYIHIHVHMQNTRVPNNDSKQQFFPTTVDFFAELVQYEVPYKKQKHTLLALI